MARHKTEVVEVVYEDVRPPRRAYRPACATCGWKGPAFSVERTAHFAAQQHVDWPSMSVRLQGGMSRQR